MSDLNSKTSGLLHLTHAEIKKRISRQRLFGIKEVQDYLFKICQEMLNANSSRLQDFSFYDLAPSVLLYGPPNTGKTSLSYYLFDRIKNEVTNEINFYTVDVGRMLDPSLGQSSRNLEQIFEDLKKVCQKGSSVFLLLDELDTFCMSRSRINEHDAIRRSMTTLMMELDKLHPSTTTKFLIFGITNVPELVDTAVVRRFSLKKNIDPQLSLDEFQSYLTYLNQSIKYELKQDKLENLYKIYLNRQFTVGDIKALYKVLYLDLMCDNIILYKDDHLLKLFESGFSTKEHLSKTYIKELIN